MTKKLKQLLAILLVFIFLTPSTIQFLDYAFHHHFYFFSAEKQDKVLHEYHRACPIPGFHLAIYTLQKLIHETEKSVCFDKLVIVFPQEYFSFELDFSFLLRAPPFLDKV